MSKILVSYFSASGVTRGIAKKIANAVSGHLFEIEPVKPYTNADLDWTNNNSRSSIEMKDKAFRPEVKNRINNIDNYDTLIIGFPVWWYTAPTIINTFIENNDLHNIRIFIFVTSGSSSVNGSFEDLKNKYIDLNFISGRRFIGNELDEEIKEWINDIH